MSKNLVLTVSVGELYNQISEINSHLMESYAEKIGADFLNIQEENPKYISQKWQKFQIFDLLLKYDRILFLDCDIIVRDDTPNIFNIVPHTKLGMFNEGRFSSRGVFIENASSYYEEPLKNEWEGNYYNSGVMVISKCHRNLFKLPTKGPDESPSDQAYINLRILNDGIEMFDLDWKYNRMAIMDKFLGINRLDSYLVHYAGAPSELIIPTMLQDLSKWENDHPNYEYKQNILVRVSAGMGDQLCSEPVIRYMRDYVYPEANLMVVTHHPRLFQHLKIPVYDYKTWNGINDALLILDTCPDDKTSKHDLSHAMFYPVDFSALSTIKRTIPNKHKQIKLGIEFNDIQYIKSLISDNFKEEKPLIAIHAGKWWPSKTFPIKWWEEIINGLDNDFNIILVGKTLSDQQGYLNITPPPRCLDLRDRITLGEYLTVISLCDITLTNDSSPTHVAGAFDNWIVVIATCKQPDHILPWRNLSQYYKTKALYKKLLIEDLETRHTEFNTNTVDQIPEGRSILDYIPEPEDVIREIKEIEL